MNRPGVAAVISVLFAIAIAFSGATSAQAWADPATLTVTETASFAVDGTVVIALECPPGSVNGAVSITASNPLFTSGAHGEPLDSSGSLVSEQSLTGGEVPAGSFVVEGDCLDGSPVSTTVYAPAYNDPASLTVTALSSYAVDGKVRVTLVCHGDNTHGAIDLLPSLPSIPGGPSGGPLSAAGTLASESSLSPFVVPEGVSATFNGSCSGGAGESVTTIFTPPNWNMSVTVPSNVAPDDPIRVSVDCGIPSATITPAQLQVSVGDDPAFIVPDDHSIPLTSYALGTPRSYGLEVGDPIKVTVKCMVLIEDTLIVGATRSATAAVANSSGSGAAGIADTGVSLDAVPLAAGFLLGGFVLIAFERLSRKRRDSSAP